MQLTKSEKKQNKILIALSKSVSYVLRLIAKPFKWFIALFRNEWEVTIWIAPKDKTFYNFKWLEKCEPKHLKGRLVSGEPFELRTQEAFNFQIRKVK